MDVIVSGFKKILKIDGADLDEDDNNTLDDVIHEYTEIINSNKYADSNSNTKAVEKLLLAMQDVNKKAEEEARIEKEKKEQNESQVVLNNFQPESLAYGRRGFLERLSKHLDLVKELEQESSFLPGQPVFEKRSFGGKFYLPVYNIPRNVYTAIEINNQVALNLQVPIDVLSYVNKFHNLLWVEEAHQAVEMHRYDLFSQMIAKYDDWHFLLVVPGLAEGRPSLMRGDRLLLRSDARSTQYEGYIHEVREKDILFKLHNSVGCLDGLRFDVTFLSSRTAFRRCHFGIDNFQNNPAIQKFVFPTIQSNEKTDLIPLNDGEADKLRCFSKHLNKFQRGAIINVLKAQCRPAPYIIFGPPGTGKTVTMVESVLQAYVRNPNSRILVCGNSNSCADLLAERIKFSGVLKINTDVARLSAFYRMEKLIPEDIEDITIDADMLQNVFHQLRIIVTTCIQSGVLYEYRKKFDYVFIDEAGHANEPEAMLSLGLVDPTNGCVVLAGDFKQLGPVVVSQFAKENGLGTSMLERLSRRSIYQRRVKDSKMSYDEKYLTKLMISYRSDPRVLKVSNELFYNNELQFVVKTPEKWLTAIKSPSPLIFHPINGRDRREYLNPSWFNPNEAIKVIVYVHRLYEAGLKPEQLGIITPYRRQIDKLYLLFERCKMAFCKIATMEEFQGDEREVIIISTVRTQEKNIKLDKKFNLGFLFDDKRFNVAVSRAKWLCIVVGDKKILKQDPCWVKFMKEAYNVPEDTARIGEEAKGEIQC